MMRRWLVFAPHFSFPPRNGADILIWDRYSAIAEAGNITIDLIGESAVFTIKARGWTVEKFEGRMRRKNLAAMRALLFRTHFLYEKFLTAATREKFFQLSSKNEYEIIVASFPSIGAWIATQKINSKRLLVETHNDEFKWFADIAASSGSFLKKKVAELSRAWLVRQFRSNAGLRRSLLVHVSRSDAGGYREHAPSQEFVVLPVGTKRRNPELLAELPPGRLQLIFFGSLSVQMNLDALRHFATELFPSIRNKFGNLVEMLVAGSNPSEEVERVCTHHGWKLFRDLDDEELDSLIAQCNFLVMPFQYTNGGKLKLVHAYSLGVPVLATKIMSGQVPNHDETSVYSDALKDWIDACGKAVSEGRPKAKSIAISRQVEEFYWDSIAQTSVIEISAKTSISTAKPVLL